jgi:hypothetical protein
VEKVIENQTIIEIKDQGNTLLKDLVKEDYKVIHDEGNQTIDIFNEKGERVWHSAVSDNVEINFGGSE